MREITLSKTFSFVMDEDPKVTLGNILKLDVQDTISVFEEETGTKARVYINMRTYENLSNTSEFKSPVTCDEDTPVGKLFGLDVYLDEDLLDGCIEIYAYLFDVEQQEKQISGEEAKNQIADSECVCHDCNTEKIGDNEENTHTKQEDSVFSALSSLWN